jgi:dipeptidyl aminopeptidase/acylaminoacyl peptidase
MTPLPAGFLSSEPFVPHTLQHLTDIRAFPNPLPEVAYNKMLAEYAALDGVSVQRIVYDSDGLKVTGLMALPENLSAGAHPLLIYNRGGSREYGKLTVLSALRNMVPFAKAGYIVLASNYRGNDGGEGREEFGGQDIHDVLNLLDIGQKHSGYDGKNTFMIGHSRGGMMTMLASRLGAPLNAAIAIASVSNAHTLAQQQPMIERVLVPLIPDYAADPKAALSRRSPIDWPDEIKAPLLLLHGDADKDVGVEASIALQEALQKANKVSELVVYPGGNHALLRHWDDVLARSFAWMERHKR